MLIENGAAAGLTQEHVDDLNFSALPEFIDAKDPRLRENDFVQRR